MAKVRKEPDIRHMLKFSCADAHKRQLQAVRPPTLRLPRQRHARVQGMCTRRCSVVGTSTVTSIVWHTAWKVVQDAEYINARADTHSFSRHAAWPQFNLPRDSDYFNIDSSTATALLANQNCNPQTMWLSMHLTVSGTSSGAQLGRGLPEEHMWCRGRGEARLRPPRASSPSLLVRGTPLFHQHPFTPPVSLRRSRWAPW